MLAASFVVASVLMFRQLEWTGVVAGGALLFAAVSLLREHKLGEKADKPGPLQESDGSVSMRRCAAAFLFVSAVGLFTIGALNDHRYAFFGGLSCLVGGALMLFFTTWSDLTGLVQAGSGLLKSAVPGLSSFVRSSSVVSASPAIADKASTADPAPPADPSLGG